MNEVNDKTMLDAAKRLQTEIAPERDLWPGIAAAMDAPRSRSRWMPMLAQAAAVVLLVGTSSAITYVAVRDQQPLTQVTPELLFERTAYGRDYNLGPGFRDARNTLVAQLDEALLQLSPESRADVERNLGLLRTAINEMNAALSEDPDNALLQAKLLRAYHEELSVLRRVGGLTRNIMVRNDI